MNQSLTFFLWNPYLCLTVSFPSAAVTGKSLSVKPVKIVAGHEPEKTNELLQALADAINKNVCRPNV